LAFPISGSGGGGGGGGGVGILGVRKLMAVSYG